MSAAPLATPPGHVRDTISREPVTKDELKDIVERLNTTSTVSKRGGEDYKDKIWDYPKVEGLGKKMLPIIDGLDERFKGTPVPKDKYNEITQNLHTSKTKASQLRYEYPRILLYPERTTLMNNTQRILEYQEAGTVAKQATLARREKWYN